MKNSSLNNRDSPNFKVVPYGTQGRTKKLYYYKCPVCGKESWIDERTYNKKIQNNEKCSSCIRSDLCKSMITKRLDNMSKEDHDIMIKKLLDGRKIYYENMSEEEKNRIKDLQSKSTSKQMIDRWNNDEYKKKRALEVSAQMKKFWNDNNDANLIVRQQIIDKLHAGRDEYFKNGTDEQHAERSKKLSMSLSGKSNTAWESMTDEEKQNKINNLLKSRKEYENSLTPEEKEIRSQLLSNIQKEIWNNRSEDERKKIINNLYQSHKKWINNMSPEEYQKNSEMHSIISSKYWNSLTPEQQRDQISKSFSRNNVRTSLNDRFEKSFKESILVNNFYYIEEVMTTENGIAHSWDYGIFSKSDNKLVMLVDLVGEFFHADKCDYDGYHSVEEYDEQRSLTVPDGVKVFIIQEMNFSKCFELMLKMLIINYDEYINNMFKTFRSIPFPEPKYSNLELLKSYQRLCSMKCDDKYHQNISLDTRVSDRIIQHFHSSIYRDRVKGNPSPYEAWYDDKLLKECIENRVIYQNYLNPNKILQGFNICKIAPKVSVFSAGRAKLLIYRYLNMYNTIFDPFSGFSGRMLGAISLNKKYIGQDVSLNHISESRAIVEFLTNNGIDINVSLEHQDILTSYGEYECLFTCPPYSDKEIWVDVPVSKYSCDDWIDICLNHFKCKTYVFVVDNTNRYKDYIVDNITNKSHWNHNSEYVIKIGGMNK